MLRQVSTMSKLTELLDELCPDGVEYRVLGDLTELSIGKFVKKTKQRDDFEYPVYNGGAEPTGYFSEWNAEADSIVIAARGSIGFVNFVTTKFWAGNSSYVLKNLGESIDRRYLYHYLKHHEHDLYKLRSTGSIPAINKKPLSQMLIGIPPLEVQQEIVRVLDAFTDLEQSLVSELELRKKQYGFYRDELLNFTANGGGELCPDGVEFRTLKEVCKEIIVPQRDRPKVFGGEIPWCRIEDIDGQFITGSKLGLGVTKDTIEGMNLRVCPEGTVLATCSASLGVVAIAAQPLVTNQTFIGLVCGEELINKYLYYFLFTQERKLKSLASTGTIPYISRKKFEGLCIPVPPLEVQHEIVRVLDAFTDLEQSLVSELELRKKQYEFYRDELLSFTPKED